VVNRADLRLKLIIEYVPVEKRCVLLETCNACKGRTALVNQPGGWKASKPVKTGQNLTN